MMRITADEDDDDILVIGIDFGTTYSGVAWATFADFESDQVNLITTWPGTGREEGKVPTELFYEDGEMMWGYEIPVDGDPIRWFKLLLLRDEDLAEELRSSEFVLRGRKMLKENNKMATELIADYLRALYTYSLQQIVKSRGVSVVDALRFHVVITIPAIWKGYARQSMVEAVKKSGILRRRLAGETTLSFAPEPEAAALSTLSEPGRKTKQGDVYMICDAGGGTVDLISYEVNQTNPVKMGEAVEGTGGLYGGIFIDEGFEAMCKARLGRRWDRLSKAGIKEVLKGEWEHAIKPQFKQGNDGKEYIVGIPAEAFGKTSLDDDSREPFIKRGRIHFKSSHIQQAFVSSFTGIDRLVDEQIGKAAQKGLKMTGIILVGGLGASPYLYDHLQAKHAKAGMSVLQSGGMRPRTAICRGAVFKGFLDGVCKGDLTTPSGDILETPIMISSTVSRASFGSVFRSTFDATEHLQEDKVWSSEELEWKADNQMRWYLKRGENVSKKDPVQSKFYKLHRTDPGRDLTIEFFQCHDRDAPTRRTSSVVPLCALNCTIDKPFSEWDDFVNSKGEVMKKFDYMVEMTPSGAAVEFVVYHGQKKLGTQNMKVLFQ
ncbi:hypothetical protein BKA58DRAFT_473205 [Alternaria rosae]|uniref:uncharacterized protein n=1 Tax=Alternaria rosae TaxID=1187941 RepID=UPI001E8DE21D|nr:uncharacterized protein BKA58DRAFT_473205 [Alternaria rosae]KAH6859112.1 hypothetical protein BKA58DRAFT_473205 [Alternaria rosae]